jgi:superfamily II DNA or RNA helicase
MDALPAFPQVPGTLDHGAYLAFLASKAPRPHASGLSDIPDLNRALKPHQRDAVEFGLRQGRWACFFDTGLGKTLIQLEWAMHAAEATNGRALILAPLAVGSQIVGEASRFGIPARVILHGSEVQDGINVCNYDRLDKLDPAAFGAVALDESSILKSFTSKTTRSLIGAFSEHRFRMCATATPAPNDHMELGQHAEFLGVMDSIEMLSRFFINDTSTASQKWRIKGHAEAAFWDWVASWARMAETPADLGYDGSAYVLPPMEVVRHRAAGDTRPPPGELFATLLSATNLHDVKRQTAEARAATAAGIVASLPAGEPCVIWCDTDYEADALLSAVAGAKEIRGSMTAMKKDNILDRFARGEYPILITKPSITGFGLNWQHCATMIFAGRSFSYEAWYQAVRRCWRFGQKRSVTCHLIVAEGEDQIGRVIASKGEDHQRMKVAMRAAMHRVAASADRRVPYNPTTTTELPAWLSAA